MNRIVVIVILSIIVSCSPYAQENTSAQIDWIKIDQWKVPSLVKIYEGTTKKGSSKYWIKLGDNIIYVKPENYQRYKKKEIDLFIVKWKHSVKDVQKFTTTKPKE